MARFNETIREMQRDGTYNRILRLSWIRVDVDGDGSPEMVVAQKAAGKTQPTHGYKLFDHKNKAPEADTVNQEYVVNGQLYERWEQVPEENEGYDLRFDSASGGDEGLFS